MREPCADAGERRADAVQHRCHIAVAMAQCLVDHLAVLTGEVAHFEQAIDKETQAKLRRHPPGRDMRAAQQAEVFEVLHHVAHRRGADLFGQGAGERAGPHRRAGFQVALDDTAEHLARAAVHFLDQGCLVGHVIPCWRPIIAACQLKPCAAGRQSGLVFGAPRRIPCACWNKG